MISISCGSTATAMPVSGMSSDCRLAQKCRYSKFILKEKAKLEAKKDFIEKRKGITKFMSLSNEEKNKLIKENHLYGHIICRCEKITEGEIVEAIKSPIGAKSLDGIKRRVRAGLGRCQGGFCSPKIMEIISRELNINILDITKSEKGSEIIKGFDKESL